MNAAIPPHCTLTKFSKLFSEFNFPNQKATHYATTARRYFYFAYFQYATYQTEVLKNFAVDEDIQRDRWQFSFSYAFGFYILMRTALEACHRLCDAIGSADKSKKLDGHRKLYRRSIKRIIDIANDNIKHPFVPTASQPGGLDHMGNMTIYLWDSENDSYKDIEISPSQDLKTIYAYIEGIAEALSG